MKGINAKSCYNSQYSTFGEAGSFDRKMWSTKECERGHGLW